MRARFLLAGIPLIVAPAIAFAAVDCSRLADAEAISKHYVQPVLDRADAGIAFAASANANPDFFPFYHAGWARSIGGAFAQLVDSRSDLANRTNDLATATACRRFDELLLECAMDDVREALDASLERGSFVAIMRLESLLLFLRERLDHLDAGAEDATRVDDQWARKRLFDRDEPASPSAPLCPFHSDYTPPRLSGYGCDDAVLESIDRYGLDFVAAERGGLTAIESQIDAFRSIVPLLQSATSTGTVAPLPPVADREHRTIVGCRAVQGACSENADLACGSDEFCASRGAGRCLRDASVPRVPERSLRGAFSFPVDHLRVLTDFVGKRIDDALSRTFPDGWAPLSELSSGSGAKRAFYDDWMNSALSGLRSFFRSLSGIQGRSEGAAFPEATDAQLEIADSLSDMRASIGELSRLASQKTGVRTFVVELAYFLRRTCVFRPCQKSLEQIIRIGLQDACFPYTNGEFLSDTEENPRWKKCAEAACVKVDGANLDGSCEQILPE